MQQQCPAAWELALGMLHALNVYCELNYGSTKSSTEVRVHAPFCRENSLRRMLYKLWIAMKSPAPSLQPSLLWQKHIIAEIVCAKFAIAHTCAQAQRLAHHCIDCWGCNIWLHDWDWRIEALSFLASCRAACLPVRQNEYVVAIGAAM